MVSFSDIMSSILEGNDPTSFFVLDSRNLFTDGFCLPKGHCKTKHQLQRYLMEHNLNVKILTVAKKPNYFWVQLEDGDYYLRNVIENLKEAMKGLRRRVTE